MLPLASIEGTALSSNEPVQLLNGRAFRGVGRTVQDLSGASFRKLLQPNEIERGKRSLAAKLMLDGVE